MITNSLCITHPRFAGCQPISVFCREGERPMSKEPTLHANSHILFRKKFHLASTEGCVIRITADDYYKLYINGRFVTQGPAPGYNTSYYYNEIPVGQFLTEGENTIAVHTYYQGLINRVWVSGDLRHMMALELLQHETPVVVSDTSWKTAPHTAFSPANIVGYCTAFTENYDSNAPECAFAAPDFDDSAWDLAIPYDAADYSFIKQPTEQLDVYFMHPASIRRYDNIVSIDFGREIVGNLSLRAMGRKGDSIVIRSGEELLEDGRVRHVLRCNCGYGESWTLSGGLDTLNQFDYKGFRYVELHLPEECKIKDEDIYAVVRHYPFREAVPFPLTHERYADKRSLLERIWRLCADTIHYSTQEIYMDCPTREKGQYLGDASITAPVHTLLTGDGAMMKKALYEYARSSFISESLMTVAPASYMQEIADYSMQYPMQLLAYYDLTGDIETLRELEPYATRCTDAFAPFEREDGLVEAVPTWNLVDWPKNLRDDYDFPNDKPTPRGLHNVINCFRYGMLCDMNRLYALLGIDRRYETERMARAFVDVFYRPSLSLFADAENTDHTAIHSNFLPLFVGLGRFAPEGTTEKIIQNIRERGLVTGVYMAYFLLEALVRVGEYDLAVDLMTAPGAWPLMLDEGATTTFEAWGKDQKWNTSLCHPWATAPILIMKEIADAMDRTKK